LKNVIPFRIQPMLATLAPEPFHREGWIYEEKYDGYRIVAYKEGNRVQLLSRNSIDRTERFARVATAVRALPFLTLLLDGEVVVFDRKKVSRFQLLQQGKSEFIYAVFDCVYKNGKSLMRDPLSSRRAAMEAAVAPDSTGALLPSRVLAANGLQAYRVAQRRGFEGLVAKDLASLYVEGRSNKWLKVKVHREDEFVIAGFTRPSGSRKHFGALLLGAYDRGKLRYVGKVGTGFDEQALASLYRKFLPFVRKKSPLVDSPRATDVTFLAPKLVAQIAYQELTEDNKLRQPVFLGLRDDKNPREVGMPGVSR
jgi:bifunctional non-homologous end joining protein LigD